MAKEQFNTAREARQHLALLGYRASTPAGMKGAIVWSKGDEEGYYLIAKTSEGARLMHYSGKPEALPAGAVVTSDMDFIEALTRAAKRSTNKQTIVTAECFCAGVCNPCDIRCKRLSHAR